MVVHQAGSIGTEKLRENQRGLGLSVGLQGQQA